MSEIKVNKAAMRLWVAGLRSGKYPQGMHRLKSVRPGTDKAVGYCCLGVFCEVALENGIDMDLTVGMNTDTVMFDGCSTALPARVIEWAGLGEHNDDPIIKIEEGGAFVSAIGANDTKQWSFDQIADALVKHYKLDEPDED